MEPVTHFLTGACLGRSGLNRLTAYATIASTLAAEAPDLDVVAGFAGPVVSLAQHRGMTHTLVAAPFMALAVTGFVWGIDRIGQALQKRRKRTGQNKSPGEPQQIRWLWIWFVALVADLSHLLLDWTNNYGVRPFYPFNGHWYSGDLVFIAEPVLWLLLVMALVVPSLLGLADGEVGARRTRFRGRGWAVFALVGMVALWSWRWFEHENAIHLVQAANVSPAPALRIAVEPYPINPWRWHALMETETSWQTAEVDTHSGIVDSDPRTNSLYKPAWTPSLIAARRTQLGLVYLNWAQWPVVRDLGQQTVPGQPPASFPQNRQWTVVEFSDLRFAYDYLNFPVVGSSRQDLSRRLATSPLSGWVYVLDGREEAGQFLEGKEQK